MATAAPGWARAAQAATRATAPVLQPPLTKLPRARQPAGVGRLGRADPVDLVEGVVGDVARMDAAAEPSHQAGRGGLSEDGGPGGVDGDEAQGGPVPAQWSGDPGAVSPGADAADEDVEVVELGGQFGGEEA